MNKFKEKFLSSFTTDWIKVSGGILISLVAIFGALSNATTNDYFIYVSRFFTWCLSFLFGSFLTYAIYFLIFLVGMSLTFSSKRFKLNINMTILGVTFIILGALILIANSQTTEGNTYLTFSNFEEVFTKNIIDGFPMVSTFENCGVIGMFLVALINSGMTYIGSNVIGSLFLVAGIFFTFSKISFKFTKIIIDYYHQTFAKKTIANDASFNLAKDISYDTTAINTIKTNQELKKNQLKANELEETKPVSNPSTNNLVSSKFSENSSEIFQPKQIFDGNQAGLRKATFSINPEEEKVNVSSPISTEKEEQIQAPYTNQAQFNVDERMKTTSQNQNDDHKFGTRISDMFTIPKSKSNPTSFSNQNLDTNHVNISNNENIKKVNEVSTQSFNTSIKKPVEEVIQNKAPQVELNRNENANEDTNSALVKFNNIDNNYNVHEEPMQNSTNVSSSNHFTREQLDALANKKPELVNPEKEYSNKYEPKKSIKREFKYPSVDLLEVRDQTKGMDENIQVADARKQKINEIFADLGVGANIISYTIGPSVTQYDLQTDKNVSISGLNKYISDVSIRLGGLDTRFVPIVQGKSTSGIEIANAKSSLVNFKDCVEKLEKEERSKMTIPFGLDIGGKFIAADLREFPHLLVCGTTGSGKSIFIHSIIMSLIMRNSPEELRLIMIDPKRVEFGKYKDIPHLLCPPVNDSNKAYIALNKLVDVMEARYTLFEDTGVSNIKQYNQEALENGKDKLPYIALICDEFADLMDTNRKCSEPIVRIGQKARAAGIHMIIATQRPSTNVITGVIKSNLPVRVALSCSSYIDSTTILGESGAEKLLGNGDMLVMCPLLSKQGFTRVQGAFVDNKEIKKVCDYLRDQGEVQYDPLFLDLEEKSKVPVDSEEQTQKMNKAFDDKYEEVKKWVVNEEYTSISKIQRTFGFGFPRAGKIFTQLEEEGIVAKESDPNNAKGRKVLVHHIEVTSQSENPGSSEVTTMDYSRREGNNY